MTDEPIRKREDVEVASNASSLPEAELTRMTDDIVAAFPSSRRYRGLSRLRAKDGDGAYLDLKASPLAASDLEAQVALLSFRAAHAGVKEAGIATSERVPIERSRSRKRSSSPYPSGRSRLTTQIGDRALLKPWSQLPHPSRPGRLEMVECRL